MRKKKGKISKQMKPGQNQQINPEKKELIFNIWYLCDNNGVIHGLRVKEYAIAGTDDYKFSMLYKYAATDYLTAEPFPVPEDHYIIDRDIQVLTGNKLPPAVVAQFNDAKDGFKLFIDAISEVKKRYKASDNLLITDDTILGLTPLFIEEDDLLEPDINKCPVFN